MIALVAVLLSVSVLAAWLAALILLWLPSALDRLHVVTTANLACGIPIVAAVFVTDGASSRSVKCALILLALVMFGALLAHVTGRAIHLREGERR